MTETTQTEARDEFDELFEDFIPPVGPKNRVTRLLERCGISERTLCLGTPSYNERMRFLLSVPCLHAFVETDRARLHVDLPVLRTVRHQEREWTPGDVSPAWTEHSSAELSVAWGDGFRRTPAEGRAVELERRRLVIGDLVAELRTRAVELTVRVHDAVASEAIGNARQQEAHEWTSRVLDGLRERLGEAHEVEFETADGLQTSFSSVPATKAGVLDGEPFEFRLRFNTASLTTPTRAATIYGVVEGETYKAELSSVEEAVDVLARLVDSLEPIDALENPTPLQRMSIDMWCAVLAREFDRGTERAAIEEQVAGEPEASIRERLLEVVADHFEGTGTDQPS